MLRGNHLSKICSEVEAKYSIRISDYARQLILMTFVALEADPQPGWSNLKEYNPEAAREFLFYELDALATTRRSQGVSDVTFFDVLHHIHTSSVRRGWPLPKKF